MTPPNNLTPEQKIDWRKKKAEYDRAYSAASRVKNAERQKQYLVSYRERNREKARLYAIEWRLKNPEKHKEVCKKTFEKNKDVIRARNRLNSKNRYIKQRQENNLPPYDPNFTRRTRQDKSEYMRTFMLNATKELKDDYIKRCIRHTQQGIPWNVIPMEMIEAKRVEIKLKRLIKEMT